MGFLPKVRSQILKVATSASRIGKQVPTNHVELRSPYQVLAMTSQKRFEEALLRAIYETEVTTLGEMATRKLNTKVDPRIALTDPDSYDKMLRMELSDRAETIVMGICERLAKLGHQSGDRAATFGTLVSETRTLYSSSEA